MSAWQLASSAWMSANRSLSRARSALGSSWRRRRMRNGISQYCAIPSSARAWSSRRRRRSSRTPLIHSVMATPMSASIGPKSRTRLASECPQIRPVDTCYRPSPPHVVQDFLRGCLPGDSSPGHGSPARHTASWNRCRAMCATSWSSPSARVHFCSTGSGSYHMQSEWSSYRWRRQSGAFFTCTTGRIPPAPILI